MVAIEPLTGARVPDQSDGPLGGLQITNSIRDIADNTIPDFTTPTTRDDAYAAWVALGYSMRNGLQCVVNGVPYRRMGGSWRIDRPRNMVRSTAPSSTISSGGGNETGVTSGIAALSNFTLYEAGTVAVMATFRGGGAGAMLCTVKIDGAQVGDVGVTRGDINAMVVDAVALAAGSHTIALHVDASGGSVVWDRARVVISEGIAE